jgi:hypothetical protein
VEYTPTDSSQQLIQNLGNSNPGQFKTLAPICQK